MRSTGRRSCCRSKATSPTAPAAASPSFDMLGGLDACAPLLTRYGGHKMAAGLTLEASRIRELRARVNDHADALLGPDDLRPRLRIDDALASARSRRRRGGAGVAGAVRAGQPAARVLRAPRRHRRRPAAAEGPALQDGAQARRPHHARDLLARRRAPRVPRVAPRRRRRRVLARPEPVQRRDVPRADCLRHPPRPGTATAARDLAGTRWRRPWRNARCKMHNRRGERAAGVERWRPECATPVHSAPVTSALQAAPPRRSHYI